MTSAGLNDQFAALEAERARTWASQDIAANKAQRAAVVARYDPAAHAQVGDRVPPFTLIDADGQGLASDAILAKGPAVLIFYRFGGCPACNIALPYYDARLARALNAAGIALIAVSPQTPVDRGPTERHGLQFPLTNDPDYALARALGITFLPNIVARSAMSKPMQAVT